MRGTPVEVYERMRMRKLVWAGFLAIVALAGTVYWRYLVPHVVDHDSPEEQFKYGSIGADAEGGLPFSLWQVLPLAFPQYLPSPRDFMALPVAERTSLRGYAQFGFLVEPGRDRPIGFSRRHLVVDRIGFNCAVCHVGRVVEPRSGFDRIISGMPATTVDLQSYFMFLFRCARDPGFTEERLMAHVEERFALGTVELFLLTRAVRPLRDALLAGDHRLAFLREVPAFGPGRVDTFNPYKTMVFGFAWDATIGTADFPALWNQRPRQGMALHWDGNNVSVFERNISAALGAGATPLNVDLHRIARVAAWCGAPRVAPDNHAAVHGLSEADVAAERRRPFPRAGELPVPAFPCSVDPALQATGRQIYARECARCHADERDWTTGALGDVVPLESIGTDRHRVDSHTNELVAHQATLGAGTWWRLRHFRKRVGYVNAPLDGGWARGPYLHNGSVPTLLDLLMPPPDDNERAQLLAATPAGQEPTIAEVVHRARAMQRRPPRFYRGDTELDPDRVGPRCDRDRDGERALFVFDTRHAGNSAAGHLYGVQLKYTEKLALVEYLKTYGEGDQ